MNMFVRSSILRSAFKNKAGTIHKRNASSAQLDRQKYKILSLPTQYLRAMDASNYDPVTFQRTDVYCDLDDGKPVVNKDRAARPIIQNCFLESDIYHIEWDDGMRSEYSSVWVDEQINGWKGSSSDRVLWTGMTEQSLRASSELTMDFTKLLTDDGMRQALSALYQYGIILIKETPIHDDGAGVAALASALGGGSIKNRVSSVLSNYLSGNREIMLPRGTDGPLRTLYGTVWATTSGGQPEGTSVADSAYGHEGLPLHTDMTYHRDPPGLQVFTMVQPAVEGGESIFGDGFAAAEHLRKTNYEAFAILSETIRRYRCVDEETGWHLEASGPVISVHNGTVVGIRHNDLDRLTDLPPPEATCDESGEFYDRLQAAHDAWDSVLAQDDSRLVVALQPGETMVVANQRCFHGRYSFRASAESPRSVIGCYVSQDELSSRLRLEGFDAR
jgi:alpha-ketoglutarate-dependent taurine dioxygenase